MIIKKISISDFGKLSDLKIEPSKNLNIIYAPNESGKTTLLCFIKFVFYGTRQKKIRSDLTFKERYMPWNGMPMSGSIEFEHSGKNYIIYRSEGAKSGSKILDVKNADTGERYVGIDSPGEFFFGVDEKVFSDTFFAHDFSALFEPDDSISSVVYGKYDADTSYNRVRNIIEEEISDLVSPKRSGSEFSLIINEAQKINEEKINLEYEIRDIEQNLLKLNGERESLEEEVENLKEEYKTVQSKNNSEKNAQISALKNREVENLADLNLQLKNLTGSSLNKKNQNKKIKFVLFFLLLIISLTLTLFCMFKKEFSSSFVGVFFMILCVFLLIRTGKSPADLTLINTLNTQIELCEKRISGYEAGILPEEQPANVNSVIMMHHVETNNFTNKEIDGIINRIQKCEIDINVKDSQILSLSERKSNLNSQIDYCDDRIKECDLKLQKIKEKQDVYNVALHILEGAFSNLRDCYAPIISKRAFEIFKKVCKNHYDSLVADDNFGISLNFENELKSIKSFSRSTKDAAGLSVRMAICDFISKDNPLPMFFDDVLSSFDDKRCSEMLECIKNISFERQVFLCTCRIRETDLNADYDDVEVIRL